MRPEFEHNVFWYPFLKQRLDSDPSGYTPAEARLGGPWKVDQQEHGYAVILESDREPGTVEAIFDERELACLMAAVLPASGRQGHYWIEAAPDESKLERTLSGEPGFIVKAVLAGRPQRVGWMRYDHPELFANLHVADSLLRSPAAFAHFLEAASADVLARGGAMLSRRLFKDPKS